MTLWLTVTITSGNMEQCNTEIWLLQLFVLYQVDFCWWPVSMGICSIYPFHLLALSGKCCCIFIMWWSNSIVVDMHWLPVRKRIDFKIATLTYNVLSTQQPAYLHNLISYHQPSCVLHSSSQLLLKFLELKPSLVVEPSLLPRPKYGMIYPFLSDTHHH